MKHIHPRKTGFKPRPSDNRDWAWGQLLWATAGLELQRTVAARRRLRDAQREFQHSQFIIGGRR